MNQEKELLERIKDLVAQRRGYRNFKDMCPNKALFEDASDEITNDFANELLKLRLGEVRAEMLHVVGYFKDSRIPFQAGREWEANRVIEMIDKTLKEL